MPNATITTYPPLEFGPNFQQKCEALLAMFVGWADELGMVCIHTATNVTDNEVSISHYSDSLDIAIPDPDDMSFADFVNQLYEKLCTVRGKSFR